MIVRSSVDQAVIIVSLSIILGLVSNWIRDDSISLLAKELEIVQSIEDITIPVESPQIKAISLEQAKILFDQRTVFVDAREVEFFEESHIPGAIAYTNFMELVFTLDSLQGKDTPCVTYCSDDECGSSEDLAYDLQSAGFTHIFVFKGGWINWIEAGYPIEK